MAKRKEGYVWHSHHDTLLSHIYDYDWRVRSIKRKPPNEIPMRLKRFQFVKGKLPDAFNEVQLEECDPQWNVVRDFVNIHKDEIEKLHDEECIGCTWNGKELVFPKHHIKRALLWIKNVLRRVE